MHLNFPLGCAAAWLNDTNYPHLLRDQSPVLTYPHNTATSHCVRTEKWLAPTEQEWRQSCLCCEVSVPFVRPGCAVAGATLLPKSLRRSPARPQPLEQHPAQLSSTAPMPVNSRRIYTGRGQEAPRSISKSV